MAVDATPSDAVVVSVAFAWQQHRWHHVFQVARGSTVLQLKERMLQPKGAQRDVDCFELRLRGKRVHDMDRIWAAQELDFEYLGTEVGGRKAREDSRTQPPTARSQEAMQRRASPAPSPCRRVRITVRHAMAEAEPPVVVEVSETASALDVRRAVAAAIGEVDVSQVSLVRRTPVSFAAWGDHELIGTVREFLSVGCSLRPREAPAVASTATAAPQPGSAAAPAAAPAAVPAAVPAAAPAKTGGTLAVTVIIDRDLDFSTTLQVPRGTTVLQIKERLAASDPTSQTRPEDFGLGLAKDGEQGEKPQPLPDETVLTEEHLHLETTNPPPVKDQPFSLERARQLQRDLMAGFGTPDFQRRLDLLLKEYPVKNLEFRRKQQELFLTVQSMVLPKYGFPGSMEGVVLMMKAYAPYGGDPEVGRLNWELNRLLRLG